MDITLKDKNGVTLHTAKKHCKEDITVRVDTQEISIIPSTEEQVKEGLFNKVIVGPMLDTSDATATAENIVKDKTAYVNGERITGTLEANDYNVKIENCTYSLYANSIEYYISEIDFTGIALKSKLCESMFQSCFMLKKIKGLNTSGVTSMYNMFSSCYELIDIEVLDTSTLTKTGMRSMFSGCTKLSDESLNNILQMCINAVKITDSSYKTLAYIGLTSAQATICQGLSNYQAFLDAGWVTGY